MDRAKNLEEVLYILDNKVCAADGSSLCIQEAMRPAIVAAIEWEVEVRAAGMDYKEYT